MSRALVGHPWPGSLLYGLLALFSVTSTGCVCTFERDWQAAQQYGIPCDNLAGLWEGTWQSNYNGHHGKLRAIITRCGDGTYHARYHATFAVLIPYAYETTHTAIEQDGVTHFSGQEDLGCLAGGMYHTCGEADGCTFTARYQADTDHGIFRMCRATGCCGGSSGCNLPDQIPEPAVTAPPVPFDVAPAAPLPEFQPPENDQPAADEVPPATAGKPADSDKDPQ